MKVFKIRIKGLTPLLQHKMSEEALFALLGTKTAIKKDKEQKTPREIAQEYAYQAKDGSFVVPTTYFVGAFKAVASEYKQKNSVRKSVKSIAAGIFRPIDEFAPLLTDDGNPITSFEVDIRKATNHQKGAVAVCRPRFDAWSSEFHIEINDDFITPEIALEILNDAGRRSGVGSFRVSKGGYFGQFIVTDFNESK